MQGAALRHGPGPEGLQHLIDRYGFRGSFAQEDQRGHGHRLQRSYRVIAGDSISRRLNQPSAEMKGIPGHTPLQLSDLEIIPYSKVEKERFSGGFHEDRGIPGGVGLFLIRIKEQCHRAKLH
jgi:hypothetical protein